MVVMMMVVMAVVVMMVVVMAVVVVVMMVMMILRQLDRLGLHFSRPLVLGLEQACCVRDGVQQFGEGLCRLQSVGLGGGWDGG